MGEVCEFNIDFEQFDDLRAVVVHDECGAHEDVWFYRFDRLKAENAKLRELVDILCFCMQIHKRCDDCKLNGAKGELGLGHDPLLACDGLHEMLKELGIEVD